MLVVYFARKILKEFCFLSFPSVSARRRPVCTHDSDYEIVIGWDFDVHPSGGNKHR